jgi:hypothetical protein
MGGLQRTDPGLMGLPVPEAAMEAWYSMCAKLTEGDLETEMEAERDWPPA